MLQEIMWITERAVDGYKSHVRLACGHTATIRQGARLRGQRRAQCFDCKGVQMRFSSNATASTLRPKNMRQLYGAHTIYLLDDGNVLHLVFNVADFAEMETRFGVAVAEWQPFSGKGRWVADSEPMNQAKLTEIIAGRPVCMLGKECQKHGSYFGG